MAPQSIPDIQKAWISTCQGTPAKSLKLVSDWPVPKRLQPEEVLVRIQAGSLNPVGWKLMKVLPNFIARRPNVAEHDFTGVIVDSNRTHFNNGDEVFGWIPVYLNMSTSQGALAQFVRVPADHLVLRPRNITPVQAAGISLASLTAYQALFDIAHLEANQTILISGGSTAVGAFAVQLAKASGARVIATASGRNEQHVRDLGADEFINYTKTDLPKALTERAQVSPKLNVIFDAVGASDSSLYTASEAYLAPNGIFVTTGPLPQTSSVSEFWKLFKTFGAVITPRWLGGTKRAYKLVAVTNKPNDLRAIQGLVAEGSVKPVVDSVYAFEDVLQAYDRLMSTHATGKVVIKVDSVAE
ncbi:hypothetical protein D9756_001938 [Leucocoprinus leucothites]|uniref:Enoyl reductase (ER) domain-containing protein n=1 Tax=Leucocoprinus leucothites TaxID=201217 RepID=A0A8H5G484_9AGAR|nr:hypothetical protein D9756_001938 [Leucoagaricus leucothites]